MREFAGKIAVITGGGTGMGRALSRQLIAEGASVAMCDVSERAMAETKRLCEAEGMGQGARVMTVKADVSIEAELIAFRDEIAREMNTDHIHLLFNNAGIGGAGSLFTDSRAAWEKTFNVCWGGVYWGTRTFLPMLVKAPEAHIVNTSSVNGFWASIGPTTPHTAYSAAKFAVKGFTEALITDLKINAPHVKCSVVMPGHIGTEIAGNSMRILGGGADDGAIGAEQIAQSRARMRAQGVNEAQMSDAQVAALIDAMAANFRDNAPMSADEAAKVILDGVRAEKWRILVGDDAHRLDERVRADPERAYDSDFFTLFFPQAAQRT